MAVAVSRDLTVQVMQDVNKVKLSDQQQRLRAAIHRGEPKSLGVSQVMLGLMVMSYSVPLHYTEVTEVVRLGVPWWSGVMFIIAGMVSIILDRNSTLKTVCVMVSVLTTALSVTAVTIYSVDMDKNPEAACDKTEHGVCSEKHYATKLSRGLKSSLLVFTLAQTVLSAIICFLLYKQRRTFRPYAFLSEAAPSTPAALNPPPPELY
ncbi:transmembrane protein 176 isoform 2-T2 [Aulostomus maculatus]